MTRIPTAILVALMAMAAHAESPLVILDQLARQAGSDASAARGEKFYRARQGGGEAASCASCHMDDPRERGRHVKTRKEIEPLAPSANRERFTDPTKVEKWYRRNCKEVLGRECTAQEKADFAAYVISVR